MVNLLNEEFQVKKPILQKYIDKIRVMKERFKKLEFIYIPKEKNEKADLLLKLRKLDDTNPARLLIEWIDLPFLEIYLLIQNRGVTFISHCYGNGID